MPSARAVKRWTDRILTAVAVFMVLGIIGEATVFSDPLGFVVDVLAAIAIIVLILLRFAHRHEIAEINRAADQMRQESRDAIAQLEVIRDQAHVALQQLNDEINVRRALEDL